jgi:hypothetical protein
MNTMHAVRMHSYGGPEVLVHEEVPIPQPEMGELWTVNNFSLSGILFDANKVAGKNAVYFQDLAKLKQDATFFIGIPLKFNGATGSPIRPIALI